MSKVQIVFNENLFNLKYRPFIDSKKSFQVFFGGSSAGKTYFLLLRAVLKLFEGENTLVFRKFREEIRDTVFADLQKIISDFGLDDFVDIRQNFRIICKNGCQIICKGIDKSDKIKGVSIKQGIINNIVIDETDRLTEADFNQLTLRLRGKVAGSDSKKTYWLSLNPILETHWIKRRFYDNPDDDVLLVHSTYKDNLENLTPDDIKRIEDYQFTNFYYWQVYGLGEWGQLDNNEAVFKLNDVLKMFDNKFSEKETSNVKYCGVDPARKGKDKTQAYYRTGNIVRKKLTLEKKDNIEAANDLEKFIDFDKTVIFNIDAGMGAGIIDTLIHRGYKVNEIPFGGSADNKLYKDKITEMWFETQKRVDDIQINFEDKELKDELIARKWKYDEIKAKIKIEQKDEFKSRFGRSPDSADAFLLTMYSPKKINIPDNLSFVGLREDPMEKFYR